MSSTVAPFALSIGLTMHIAVIKVTNMMLHWSGIMSYCLCEIVILIHHFKDSISFLHDLFQTGRKQKNVTGLCERPREVVSVWNPFHVVIKTPITSCLGTNAPTISNPLGIRWQFLTCGMSHQWADIHRKTWTVGKIVCPSNFRLYDAGDSIIILKELINLGLSLIQWKPKLDVCGLWYLSTLIFLQ